MFAKVLLYTKSVVLYRGVIDRLYKLRHRKRGYSIETGKLELLKQVAAGIAAQFGSSCEVVIHDLSRNPDHSIVAIINGHVSGRKVGDGAPCWTTGPGA